MCDSSVTLALPGPVSVEVDACMADIILALNNGGISTYGCCCGHGKQRGYVALTDGRALVIFDMRVEPDEADLNRALGIIPSEA